MPARINFIGGGSVSVIGSADEVGKRLPGSNGSGDGLAAFEHASTKGNVFVRAESVTYIEEVGAVDAGEVTEPVPDA